MLEADRNMAIRQIDHQLQEIAVAHEDETGAAAIDIATLTRERKECRIDEELLIAIRLRGRGAGNIVALARCQLALAIKGNVANGGGDGEYPVDEVHDDHVHRRSTMLALTPPKPKPFEMACSIAIGRA